MSDQKAKTFPEGAEGLAHDLYEQYVKHKTGWLSGGTPPPRWGELAKDKQVRWLYVAEYLLELNLGPCGVQTGVTLTWQSVPDRIKTLFGWGTKVSMVLPLTSRLAHGGGKVGLYIDLKGRGTGEIRDEPVPPPWFKRLQAAGAVLTQTAQTAYAVLLILKE
jgi:hypothetical protein